MSAVSSARDVFSWRPGILPEPEPKPESEPEPQEESPSLNEYQRRVARRTLNLLDAGFSMDQILRLDPSQRSFDWHDAERLVRSGCTHETAVLILED